MDQKRIHLKVDTNVDAHGRHRFTIEDDEGGTHAMPPRSWDSEGEARGAGEAILNYVPAPILSRMMRDAQQRTEGAVAHTTMRLHRQMIGVAACTIIVGFALGAVIL